MIAYIVDGGILIMAMKINILVHGQLRIHLQDIWE